MNQKHTNAIKKVHDNNPESLSQLLSTYLAHRAYDSLRLLVSRHNAVEIVEAVIVLTAEHRRDFFCTVLNPECLVLLPEDLKEEVIDLIGVDCCAQVLRHVSGVKVYMFLSSLPRDLQYALLLQMPADSTSVIEELLSYPEDSAGKLMDKDYILLPCHLKVRQVIDMLSNHRSRSERGFYQLFVVDSLLRPVGIVSASDLLYEAREKIVADIMSPKFKSIQSGADQEEVVRMFRNYSLLSLAVLDSEGSIAGVIYADDVIDVVHEEAGQDLMKLGGISESDVDYRILSTSFKRVTWLLVSFLAINCASLVVSLFNDVLNRSIELVALMPIIAAMGGNAGLQASTVSLRALSINKFGAHKPFSLLRKEFVIGLINGIILSSAMFLIIMFRFDNFIIAFSFAISMILLFSIATLSGAMVPIILERLGMDPCLSSSVLTSALTDMLAIYLLLKVASFFVL